MKTLMTLAFAAFGAILAMVLTSDASLSVKLALAGAVIGLGGPVAMLEVL
jgi:hypothetical protein